jgi:hypothetical protein
MPLALPVIDDRRYQKLVEEALARVPVHTPEWTNFNDSDPGVTLVQLFAFLTESLLYRANQIPERNRIKFLQLLGMPLAPGSAARGLITINNERGPATTQTLASDLEVRAGAISFRTDRGLAVLPVETRVFFKRPMAAPAPNLVEYYRLLYASYQTQMPVNPQLYETIALDPAVIDQVDLGNGTVDRSLWIALLGRADAAGPDANDRWKPVRDELAGRTLTLGLVPSLDAVQTRLAPGGQAQPSDLLAFELPQLAPGRTIARDADGRPAPRYRQLEARTDVDVLTTPGVVQLALPSADDIGMWIDLDPLEAGVGDLPPTLDDSALADRLITWLRVRATGAARARVLWVGINAVAVQQRERVIAESLADGDGTPDQMRRLSRAPVLENSIAVVTQVDSQELRWSEIDDLAAAGPEVPVIDPRLPPGTPAPPRAPTEVFVADHEAGTLTFGDGLRGRRLPLGARVFANYEFCRGAAGNVATGGIKSAPLLPSGFTVANPVRTWGGADAESVVNGEKQVKRFLQHRDRLVSVADFEAIAFRAPGVDVGRIEVLPAFHPDLSPNEPGAAPGVVTIMAIPQFDPVQPDAPRADRLFLNNLCRYLDPRRLVTTELIVRGPIYKELWISVGVDVAAGYAVAEVVEGVKQQLRQFLSPLPPPTAQGGAGFAAQSNLLFAPPSTAAACGWPLRTAVNARVLLAATARVAGVTSVVDVLLAEGTRAPSEVIEMAGLELPRILGISVVAGDPMSIADLRGDALAVPAPPSSLLPVPIVPETCS